MKKMMVWLLCSTLQLSAVDIERYQEEAFQVLPKGVYVEKLADGFQWVEGPAWKKEKKFLVFSDIPHNVIWKWDEKEGLSQFLENSGYDGFEPFLGKEPGSNGLAWDQEGCLLICEHGNRRVTRLEADGAKTIIADHYQGLRFNSPNDVISLKNGDVLFTDPPYGLEKAFDDPMKELPYQGVYLISSGELTLLTNELKAPNGLGTSPKGDILYVSNSDPEFPVWYAFDFDGKTVANPRVFADASPWVLEGAGKRLGLPDGFAVSSEGFLFAAGPGGFYVISPQGAIIAFLNFGHPVSNCTWGEDEHTLFLTGNQAIYRLKL
jgi:gluconolactonase